MFVSKSQESAAEPDQGADCSAAHHASNLNAPSTPKATHRTEQRDLLAVPAQMPPTAFFKDPAY